MKHTVLSAVSSVLLLTSCGWSQSKELTRSKAKEIIDKVASQPTITQIILTADQALRMQKLGEKANDSFAAGSWKVCLPDPSDVRIATGDFVLCQGAVPSEVTWQRPGVLVQLKKPTTWTLLEVTGISDAPNAQNEKIVEYTWQYDISSFAKETKDALQFSPRPGKALLRLYDDGWRFVEFR
jgi:hypothetical protein